MKTEGLLWRDDSGYALNTAPMKQPGHYSKGSCHLYSRVYAWPEDEFRKLYDFKLKRGEHCWVEIDVGERKHVTCF